MSYQKKTLTSEALDGMRIALSVQPRRLSNEPVCDFCGAANPVVVYAASRMSTGVERDCWRWCACRDCEHAVDSENFDYIKGKLVGKLTAMYRAALGMDMAQEFTAEAVEMALAEFHRYAIREDVA